MKFRIGHGIDIHRFTDGDHIVLGGVKVPHTHGIDAHSDGDVVLHSITDALLGALGLGDIGEWFPDTDPELKGIDSKNLIMPIIMCMRDNGFELNNLDVTIVAQQPRLSNYKDAMKANLLELFSVNDGQINIKATTPEKMGYIGRLEGIEAHAVLTLVGQEKVTVRKKNQFFLMPEELVDPSDTSEVRELNIEDLDGEIDLGADDLSDT